MYTVLLFGVTEILEVVAPVLHKYVPPPEAVNVTLAPAQIIASLAAAPDVSVTEIVAATTVGETGAQFVK